MNYERSISSLSRGPRGPWFDVEYDLDRELPDAAFRLLNRPGKRRHPTADRQSQTVLIWSRSNVGIQFPNEKVVVSDFGRTGLVLQRPHGEVTVGNHTYILPGTGDWVDFPEQLGIGRRARYVAPDSATVQHYRDIDRRGNR